MMIYHMKACRCNRLHRHFFPTNNYLFIFRKKNIFLKKNCNYRTKLQVKAILQNKTSRKSDFTEQNFKKARIYRSELQKSATLQIKNSIMFHFSPFFKSNYFLIQISDFNFESCTRIGIARSVDFRRVPANGYMSVTGYSNMPSYYKKDFFCFIIVLTKKVKRDEKCDPASFYVFC